MTLNPYYPLTSEIRNSKRHGRESSGSCLRSRGVVVFPPSCCERHRRTLREGEAGLLLPPEMFSVWGHLGPSAAMGSKRSLMLDIWDKSSDMFCRVDAFTNKKFGAFDSGRFARQEAAGVLLVDRLRHVRVACTCSDAPVSSGSYPCPSILNEPTWESCLPRVGGFVSKRL